MPFTSTDDPQLYGLEVSLSNTLMIGLFRSNNRIAIFSNFFIHDFHLKFFTCLQIVLFLNKRPIVHFCGWRGRESKKIGHFL